MGCQELGVPEVSGSERSISLGHGTAQCDPGRPCPVRRLGLRLAALTVLLYSHWPASALTGPCLHVHTVGGALKLWPVLPSQTLKGGV